LFCRGQPPHSSYLFKHALVQDAAYGTLLRSRRQELHARVAAVLERDFAELIERQPELLAHHLTAAGETERAVAQWLKAGQHAAARLAHVEAIAHLERGLGLLRALPESTAHNHREIQLQLALGVSSMPAKGVYSALPVYARALELAEQYGDDRQRFVTPYGLWQSNAGAGQISAARQLSQRLLRVTDKEADTGLRLEAHHSAWTTGWFSGEPAVARHHAEAGQQLYDPERHQSLRLHFGGHDPGVCARLIGGNSRWMLGHCDAALESSIESIALAERIAHPFGLLIALEFAGVSHVCRGDTDSALACLDRADELAAEQRMRSVLPRGVIRGAALTMQGAFGDAADCIREGLKISQQTVAVLWRPFGLASLAEALTRLGDHQGASAAVTEGLAAVTSGERVWESELHRLNGFVLLAQNRRSESQAAFERALDIARRQQAKSFELRAATSLARLWGEQGRRAEAKELLAPIYGWFAEGFDTSDLREAKAVLAALA
jgi:tetratricopeptide (TPR) repeat protein